MKLSSPSASIALQRTTAFSSSRSSTGLSLAFFLLVCVSGSWHNGVDAFSFHSWLSPTTLSNRAGNLLFSSTSPAVESSNTDANTDTKKIIVVLGGSGFIGRRVCKELVESSSSDDEYKVVSISRGGKPQSWSLGGDSSWSERVEWIQHEIGGDDANEAFLAETLSGLCGTESSSDEEETSPAWDATIVGCIGDLDPIQEWTSLWGLNFNDTRLLEDNGVVYEAFLNQTASLSHNNLWKVERCVLFSLDYIGQKCLEGPIEGYVDGKRLAERRFLETTGYLDNVVVLGLSNFVFGGKRFPNFGKSYRKFVESPPAKSYTKANNALRSLGSAGAGNEDWVEEMLFSSPMDVEFAGKAAAMAARGLVTRDLVNEGEPRKQGFYNEFGKPVFYDNILFVDGTHEIEKLVEKIDPTAAKQIASQKPATSAAAGEPKWEGALIGKQPYLYPIPVASAFLYLFWGVVTQQFIQAVPPA